MSLLKARNLKREERVSTQELMAYFNDILDEADGSFEQDQVVELIRIYTDVSLNYLEDVAFTLVDNASVSSTMKFMNSYIAETMHKAGLKYYDRERGFSVIDKAIQYALDNHGIILGEKVNEILGEIEESYMDDVELEEAQ